VPAPLAPQIEQSGEALADPYPEQFERFYSESRGRIYNLAARVVGDPDDAADITQEVFLRAFAHPPDAHGRQHPEPWLYRVAMNVCYDHLRRRSARATTPLEDAGEIAAAGDGFAESEMTRAVEAALGALNVRYRTALVLKDLHGLETGEVAEAMGVSKATARVLLHRSRSAFRRAFGETAPAGAGAGTGAGAAPVLGLAAFLPNLPLPASLQTLAPLTALVPAAQALLAPLPATGVMVKIGGALSAKAAAVALAAAVATGGGLAAHEMALRGGDGLPVGGGATASSVSAEVVPPGPAGAAHEMSPRTQRRMQEGAQRKTGAQRTRTGAGESVAGGGAEVQLRSGESSGGGSGGGSGQAGSAGTGVAGAGSLAQASSGGGAPQSGTFGAGDGGGRSR
jgi:RNA polymerase sigma-70 factor (ECF subfamily)